MAKLFLEYGSLFLLALLFLVAPDCARAGENKLPFTVPKRSTELAETVLIETNRGPFEIRFFREDAPVSVANFQHLARVGYYEGVVFHEFRPGFMIQTGDPTGRGKGGPGYTLAPEISKREHVEGTIGYARLPDAVNSERRSHGSQFYITLARARHIDGFYTVFAQVIRGIENVRKLKKGDRILRIRFPKGEFSKDKLK